MNRALIASMLPVAILCATLPRLACCSPFSDQVYAPVTITPLAQDDNTEAKLGADAKKKILSAKSTVTAFLDELQRGDDPHKFLDPQLKTALSDRSSLARTLGLEPEEAIMEFRVLSFQISSDGHAVKFDCLLMSTLENMYRIGEFKIGVVAELGRWKVSELRRIR